MYEVGSSVIEDYNGLERKLSLNLQSSVMNLSIGFIIISEMVTCDKRTHTLTFCPCCMQIEFFHDSRLIGEIEQTKITNNLET